MLTVACVLRSGGRYRPEWVAKLQRGVAANLSTQHRFICLSDMAVTCDRIPLVQHWPGWWSKIELFRPELFEGPVLYLDLDSLIVGPLDDLIAAGGFWMTRDFLGSGHNSSVMFWDADVSEVFRQLRLGGKAVMDRYDRWPGGRVGDQAFIEDVLAANARPIHTFDAAHVVSWKKDAKDGPPPGARVVAFHGRTKMPDQPGWARTQWENL